MNATLNEGPGWPKSRILKFFRKKFGSLEEQGAYESEEFGLYFDDYGINDGGMPFALSLANDAPEFQNVGLLFLRTLANGSFGGRSLAIIQSFNTSSEVAEAVDLEDGIGIFAGFAPRDRASAYDERFLDAFSSGFRRDLDLFVEIARQHGVRFQQALQRGLEGAPYKVFAGASGGSRKLKTAESLEIAAAFSGCKFDQTASMAARLSPVPPPANGFAAPGGGWDKGMITGLFSRRFHETRQIGEAMTDGGHAFESWAFRPDAEAGFCNLIMRGRGLGFRQANRIILLWLDKLESLGPHEDEIIELINASVEVSLFARQGDGVQLTTAFDTLRVSPVYSSEFLTRFIDSYLRDLALVYDILRRENIEPSALVELTNFLRGLHQPDRHLVFAPALTGRFEGERDAETLSQPNDLMCPSCEGIGRTHLRLKTCATCGGSGLPSALLVASSG